MIVAEPAERELALALLGLPTVVADVVETLEPHRLCAYLHGLAGAFTTFYERCPVLGRARGCDVRLPVAPR
ncbi:MAG TPA: DALR anticodon-binding domain-containing protein [Actinophytocola sp.]|nr:DALR anticodon-binding domain-containing protein [Actinophytocola sp.]